MIFTDYIFVSLGKSSVLQTFFRNTVIKIYQFAEIISQENHKFAFKVHNDTLYIPTRERNRFILSFPNVKSLIDKIGFMFTFYTISTANEGITPPILEPNYIDILQKNNFNIDTLRNPNTQDHLQPQQTNNTLETITNNFALNINLIHENAQNNQAHLLNNIFNVIATLNNQT